MAETPTKPNGAGDIEIPAAALRRRITTAYATPIVGWPWPNSDGVNDSLAKAILAAEKRAPTAENNMVGGWSSKKDLLSWRVDGTAELARRIRSLAGAATRATNARGAKLSVRFRLEAWANVLRRGGYHNVHDHPNAVWSGVYYVRGPAADPARPLSGLIEFLDPRQGADANSLPGSLFRERLRYRTVPGLMLVFPGWLRHMVHPVSGEGERISISFNVYGAEIGRPGQARQVTAASQGQRTPPATN